MKMNRGLSHFWSQIRTIEFGIRPGIYLLNGTTARAMDALYPAVAGKPRGAPNPAFNAEPLTIGGFSAFWTERILYAHSE
jgi:hypothetical protein